MVFFHRQGYNNTGINQIIDKANVSKASFYQYFKSKNEQPALQIEWIDKKSKIIVQDLLNASH